MELNGIMGRLYNGMDWIAKLVYVQFLWLLGSVAGLVIGGIFPATMAMYAVLRKMIQREEEFSFFQTFWTSYRREFWKANALGGIIALLAFILYFYLVFLKAHDGAVSLILYILVLSITFVSLITNLFLGPVFVHYKLHLFQYLKMSLLFCLSYPFHGISLAGGLVAFYFFMTYVPGLLPFLSVSLLAWFLMFIANLAFEKAKYDEAAKKQSI
ncbi:DUF624 domain-containing protein [Rhodococcus qingshengii]|nr:DUF624 domain-containing protein [Rhodococcus qingshengii]